VSRDTVAVIGAGAAGLMAAAELHEAGVPVTVLEARERTGGRILTARVGDCAAELGAEFLHGDAPLTHEVLERAAVETAPLHTDEFEARDGRVGPPRLWQRVERVLERLDAERATDRSFADFLRADHAIGEDAREAALAFVEGFHAADPERLSERMLAAQPDADEAVTGSRVSAGQDRIITALEARLGEEVRTGHRVRRVEWRRGGVRISGESAGGAFTLEARAAVITVPLPILRGAAGAPPFTVEPAVPRLRRALDSLAFGPVVRVALELDRPPRDLLAPVLPADADDAFFLHTPRRAFNVLWTAEPPEAPVLVAWSGGPRSAGLPSRNDRLRALILDDLAAASGMDAAALGRAVRALHWHDWRADPWTLGAYSYPAVGGEAVEPFDEDGTLFFAGEAFGGESLASVEGAIATGRAAARAVVEALG